MPTREEAYEHLNNDILKLFTVLFTAHPNHTHTCGCGIVLRSENEICRHFDVWYIPPGSHSNLQQGYFTECWQQNAALTAILSNQTTIQGMVCIRPAGPYDVALDTPMQHSVAAQIARLAAALTNNYNYIAAGAAHVAGGPLIIENLHIVRTPNRNAEFPQTCGCGAAGLALFSSFECSARCGTPREKSR